MQIYEGFKNYKDLINLLNDKQFKIINNYKIVQFRNEFYAIGDENPIKEIIIGEQRTWYIDEDGYMICKDTKSINPHFVIDNPIYFNFHNGIYKEMLNIDKYISLFSINNDKISKIDNPPNCYFVMLGLTFHNEFYTLKDIDNLGSYFHKYAIELFKRDLFNFKNMCVISINPFRSQINIKDNNSEIITNYKPIWYEHDNKVYIEGYQIKPVLKTNEENYKKYNNDKEIDNLSEKEQLEIIEKNPLQIMNIKNPSHDLQSSAIKIDPMAIFYIDNPEKDIIKTIFEINPEIIKTTNVITEDIIKYILLFKPGLMESLAKNININFSKQMIDFIILQNIDVTDYIDEIDDSRKIELVRKNGVVIQFINNPTFIMKLDAIHENQQVIQYIKFDNNEDLKFIIRNCPTCIKYMQKIDKDIQKYILNLNIDYIKYLKDIDVDVLYGYIDKIKEIEQCEKNVRDKIHYFKNKKLITDDKNYKKRIPDEHKLSLIYDSKLNKQYDNESYESITIDNEDAFDCHIKYVFNKIQCNNFDIACGFVHKSGLYLLDDEFDSIIKSNGKIKLIIGSLKDYEDNKENGNIACEMDKNTAEYINKLILNKIKIKTYCQRFYHGKFYFLHGLKNSCAIIGSSNISKNGFFENYELNVMFIFKNGSKKYKEFNDWYNNLWELSKTIVELNEDLFTKNDFEYGDSIDNKENLNHNENETPREFQYLIDEKPDYKKDKIKAFEGCHDEYSAFYYKGYNKLLILDSLNYQNAIYIFKNVDNVDNFLNTLQTKGSSKSKIEFVETINHSIDKGYENKVKQIIKEISNW